VCYDLVCVNLSNIFVMNRKSKIFGSDIWIFVGPFDILGIFSTSCDTFNDVHNNAVIYVSVGYEKFMSYTREFVTSYLC